MHYFIFPFFLFLSSLFLHASLAEIICEDLPHDVCAFSISSSGKRCLLETAVEKDDKVEYQCRTSEVMVERMAGYIESNKCVHACGVNRNSIGISSDSLLEPKFTSKLCAPACYHHCPNIVDLFFNLAAGEGVFLPDLCAAQRINPRRSMVEFMSDSKVAPGSISSEASDLAPSSEEDSDDEDEDLAPSSEEAPGPMSSEDSDLAPSSEEAPDEDSDLAPGSEEASSPIYSEGSTSAPTPAPMGALASTIASASASTSAPVPAPMGASVSSPTSAQTPAPASASISAPGPAPLGAIISALASIPAPTPAPLGTLASTSISTPGPAPLLSALASIPTPSPLEALASSSISAPVPTPLG